MDHLCSDLFPTNMSDTERVNMFFKLTEGEVYHCHLGKNNITLISWSPLHSNCGRPALDRTATVP